MGKTTRKKISTSIGLSVRSSGNIFADLELPDAKELQTKLRLAYAINRIAEESRMSQARTAEVLGVPQPNISSLRNYKLAGFSVERLMIFLTALGQDVEISIRKRVTSRGTAKITVVGT